MHDLDALHRVFEADQAAAAHEDAAERFAAMAGAHGVDYSKTPSPWLLRLVRRARRTRCPHWPQEGQQVVHLPTHLARLECSACAETTPGLLQGSLDEGRCDLCRTAAPLDPFAFQLGTLLVTGRHCDSCRPTVYGEAA